MYNTSGSFRKAAKWTLWDCFHSTNAEFMLQQILRLLLVNCEPSAWRQRTCFVHKVKTLQQWCQALYIMWPTGILIEEDRMRWWCAHEGHSCSILLDWWSSRPTKDDQTGQQYTYNIWSWSLYNISFRLNLEGINNNSIHFLKTIFHVLPLYENEKDYFHNIYIPVS